MVDFEYPKVLVVSNNSFSQTNSNGRTLGNFFAGWPKERLAQFCISTTEPDYKLCDNYYVITDREMLSAFTHFRKAMRVPIEKCIGSAGNTIIHGETKSFKTPTKMLLRNIVWGRERWASKDFNQWVDDFNPDIVLLMNSDSAFMFRVAEYVANRSEAKIAMFNTEGFYFFKKSWTRMELAIDKWAFPFYQSIYRKTYLNFMRNTKLVIYGNSLLEEDYQTVCKHKSAVLYTSSELDFNENPIEVSKPVFSYLGNFGFNRAKALVEIAEILQSINPTYKLDVYGKFPSKDVEDLFNNCQAVNIKGFISYEKVKEVIYNSTILFHAEVQDEAQAEGLRYGFTTKIADSISSGRCFFMYSSPEIAGAKYIIETQAAWFAKTKDEVKVQIERILNDSDYRDSILRTAKRIASENHNMEVNKERFVKMLIEI